MQGTLRELLDVLAACAIVALLVLAGVCYAAIMQLGLLVFAPTVIFTFLVLASLYLGLL